ncbi:MAG TPA: sigma 54-interacting transcriptional regulator [Polyangiaceae bacterium]|nr:sigma 54-interacting transcriptional regulator [Polyangiaceae bacterium]
MSKEFTRAAERVQIVQYRKLQLTVTKGPDTGLTFEAAGASVRIGTSPENDLVLNDETVSRRHCEVMLTERGIRVTDAGSTNGVMVGSSWVEDATYSSATLLELGDTTISVVPLSETVAREQLTANGFGDLLGRSSKMRELFADLARISATDLSLLVEGETGTGKELVAESVHQNSLRATGPFVVFDCSAIAPTLAESELFGHERGAFTGAVAPRAGVFEQADGGTIFLDEIGELPLELQPKLLRVLEKREVRRVGGSRTIPVNVRLIAATNRNLRAEVKRGEFRQDLYYRLAGAHVYVPPLRDRLDDLPLLAEAFLAASQPPRSMNDVPQHVWDMFKKYRWPGNVRELRNAVRRVLVQPERPLDTDSIPDMAAAAAVAVSVAGGGGTIEPLRVARRSAADAFEKRYVEHVLGRSDGNVTRAAAIAEVSRQVIHKLMTKHGL